MPEIKGFHEIGGFSLASLKRHPALIPCVAICGAGALWCATYIGYMCATKPDISFRPWSWGGSDSPYMSVKPKEIRKMYNVHHYEINPEIEALKAEVGSWQK